jgi:hypothetical protein
MLDAEDRGSDILAASQPGHDAPPHVEPCSVKSIGPPIRVDESEIREVPGHAGEIGKLGGEDLVSQARS